MEFKDTVKSILGHSEGICCPYCFKEFGIEDKIENERELQVVAQARREIVEWVNTHFEDVSGRDSREQILAIGKHRWQAKLKEWGIEYED